MITFDALTLLAIKNEIQDFIEGSVINKIQQPTRREFIFSLRNHGKVKKLYANIDPSFYHICFISEENTAKRLLTIPQKPPMFCMLLRKYLANSKISHINIPKNERILEFYINSYNEIGEKIYLCLAFEFMGKHSNIILYNYDTNIIIGCAHNIGAEKSREREIYGSLPYVYPPKQYKSDILNYNGELNYETLVDDFYLISKSSAHLFQNSTLEEIKKYVSLENLSPVISIDFSQYSLYSKLLENSIPQNTINEMLDNYYAYHIYNNKITTLKRQYKSQIEQKLKKVQKSLSQIQYKLEKTNDFDKYRLFGDLIIANLYQLKPYEKFAQVYDYENDKNITLELDETKTLKDNANNFYKMYNKAKNTQLKLKEFEEENIQKKEYLEQILYSIDISQDTRDLAEIIQEIDETSDKSTPKKSNESNILTIKKDDNTIIYVGKNNKQNDFIISKIASEDDLWFHAHNTPGSHVLLKSQKITDELIFECAKLAKQYSTAKDSAKTGIIYTKRKYLRKPPKATLGYVTYRNEKEIVV